MAGATRHVGGGRNARSVERRLGLEYCVPPKAELRSRQRRANAEAPRRGIDGLSRLSANENDRFRRDRAACSSWQRRSSCLTWFPRMPPPWDAKGVYFASLDIQRRNGAITRVIEREVARDGTRLMRADVHQGGVRGHQGGRRGHLRRHRGANCAHGTATITLKACSRGCFLLFRLLPLVSTKYMYYPVEFKSTTNLIPPQFVLPVGIR